MDVNKEYVVIMYDKENDTEITGGYYTNKKTAIKDAKAVASDNVISSVIEYNYANDYEEKEIIWESE